MSAADRQEIETLRAARAEALRWEARAIEAMNAVADENERLVARVTELQEALRRIERAHAPAAHLQDIARAALAAAGEGEPT